MTRRFQHGELHLVLLALLTIRPMHGYELMGELARRMGRRYRASPGSIYPAVAALEAEGLIASADESDRRVYAITESGRDALERRREQLGLLEGRLGVRFTDDGGVDSALARFTARVRAASVVLEPEAVMELLDRAAGEVEALAAEERRT